MAVQFISSQINNNDNNQLNIDINNGNHNELLGLMHTNDPLAHF